jgi:hypothetical protein
MLLGSDGGLHANTAGQAGYDTRVGGFRELLSDADDKLVAASWR